MPNGMPVYADELKRGCDRGACLDTGNYMARPNLTVSGIKMGRQIAGLGRFNWRRRGRGVRSREAMLARFHAMYAGRELSPAQASMIDAIAAGGGGGHFTVPDSLRMPASNSSGVAPSAGDPSVRSRARTGLEVALGFRPAGFVDGRASRGVGRLNPPYNRSRALASINGLGVEAGPLERLGYKLLGIGDPVAYWEGPNADLGAVWAKYSKWIDSLAEEAEGVLSEGTKRILRGQAQNAYRIMSPLKNSFAAGAIPGERDRKRMGDFVKAVREFKSALEKGKAEFGWAPPGHDVPALAPGQPIVGPDDGIPWNLILAGIGVAFLGAAIMKKKTA